MKKLPEIKVDVKKINDNIKKCVTEKVKTK